MKNHFNAKRILLTTTIALGLVTVVAGSSLVDLAWGNPFSQSQFSGELQWDSGGKQPSVSILLQNNGVYRTHDISLDVNISTKGWAPVSDSNGYHFTTGITVREVYFAADWLPYENMIYRAPTIADWANNTAKYYFMGNLYDNYADMPKIDFEKFSLNLTSIPEGTHHVTLYAVGTGEDYYTFKWYVFYVTGFSRVDFIVDSVPPAISILSEENKAYANSSVSLNFSVNESVSRITYVLDNQESVTLDGNTTLMGLSVGLHNITVYAWDAAGNMGESETAKFTVVEPESFPTVPMVAGVAGGAVFAGVGLVVYHRKRKQQKLN